MTRQRRGYEAYKCCVTVGVFNGCPPTSLSLYQVVCSPIVFRTVISNTAMFARLAAFTMSALPLLAAATPAPGGGQSGGGGSRCNTGSIQCCQSTETVSLAVKNSPTRLQSTYHAQASSVTGAALLGLLGIVVQDVNVLLGIDCSPINVVGVGSSDSCSTSQVCCEDNSHVSSKC